MPPSGRPLLSYDTMWFEERPGIVDFGMNTQHDPAQVLRWQFSLRTLLIGIGVVAVVLGASLPGHNTLRPLASRGLMCVPT